MNIFLKNLLFFPMREFFLSMIIFKFMMLFSNLWTLFQIHEFFLKFMKIFRFMNNFENTKTFGMFEVNEPFLNRRSFFQFCEIGWTTQFKKNLFNILDFVKFL